MCTFVSEACNKFDFIIEDRFSDFKVTITVNKDATLHKCDCGSHLNCCHHSAAALIKTSEILEEKRE